MKALVLFTWVVSLPFLGLGQKIPEDLRKVTKEDYPNDEYYIELAPKMQHKGVMVVFPGLFDHPYSIFIETNLVDKARTNGYIVVIPVLSEENNRFSISTVSMSILDQMVGDVFDENNLDSTTALVVGGFSVGGTRAIEYHAYRRSNPVKVGKENIDAVFAIDPPLDFGRLINTSPDEEADILLELLKEEWGNKSLSEQEMLKQLSLFLPDTVYGNDTANYVATKLRIYCEPDIQWFMENRGRDFYGMNVLDASGYINALKKSNGENQVELVITEGKGYRKGSGERHPHSWSIMDVDDFFN